MATFVEQATLLVKDKSTDEIKQINRALNSLFRTADKLRSVKASITITGTPAARINQLATSLTRLQAAASRVQNISPSLRVKGLADFERAGRDVAALVTQLGATGPSPGLRSIARLIKQMRTDAQATRAALSGVGGARGSRGVGGAGGGGVVPPAGRNSRSGGVGPRSVRIDAGPLSIALAGFQYELAHTIRNAIVTGFREGARIQDIGLTSLTARGATPDQIAAIRQIAAEASARTDNRITEGRLVQVASELFPDAPGVAQQRELVPQVARAMSAFMQIGLSAEEAQEGMLQFVKAMTAGNKVFDDQGNILKDFGTNLDAFLKASIGGGADLTPAKLATISRNLGELNRHILDVDRAFVFFAAEDVSTRAATGMNTLQRMLTGTTRSKGTVEALNEIGLTTGKTGPVEGFNEAGRSIVKWTTDFFLPALKESGKSIEQGISDLKLSRGAADAFTAIVFQIDEFNRRMKASEKFVIDQEGINRNLNQSITVAAQTLRENFNNALGVAAQSLSEVLVPAINQVSDGLKSIAEFIRGPDGAGDAGRAALVVGGGLAGLAATALTLKTAGGLLLRAGLAMTGRGVAGAAGAAGAGAAAGAAGGGLSRFLKGMLPTTLLVGAVEALRRAMNTEQGKDLSSSIRSLFKEDLTGIRSDFQKWLATKEINDIASRNTSLTGVPADLATPAQLSDRDRIDAMALKMWDESGERVKRAMSDGAVQAGTTVQTNLESGGAAAGDNIASRMIDAGASIAANIAAAISNAAANIQVNVNPRSAPDTGVTQPME
jgi:hypothetical protein